MHRAVSVRKVTDAHPSRRPMARRRLRSRWITFVALGIAAMIGLSVVLRPPASSVVLASSPKLTSANETYESDVFDIIVLLDRSGSMLVGDPILFAQLRDRIVDELLVPDVLPVGSIPITLKVYTFSGDIDEVCGSGDLDSASLSDVRSCVLAIEDPVKDAPTRLWDIMHMALEDMEAAVAADDQRGHSQLILVYTDGEDVGSTHTEEDVMEFHGDGDVLIWEGCINEPVISEDVAGIISGCLGDGGGTPPTPQLLFITPNPLVSRGSSNLGIVGKDELCMNFWFGSETTIGGRNLNFGYKPPVYMPKFPAGVDLHVCDANSGGCARSVEISAGGTCLAFELINYTYEDMTAEDFGRYLVSIPIAVEDSEGELPVIVQPSKIKLHFEIPTPPPPLEGCTDPEMKGYDPLAEKDDGSCEDWVYGCMDEETKNYDPLAEKDDGSCEYPPVVLDCSGEAFIDLGTFDSGQPEFEWLSSRERVVEVGACLLDWGKAHPSSTMGVRIEPADNNPTDSVIGSGGHLWLEREGEQAGHLLLTPEDEHISIAASLDDALFEQLDVGEHLFRARIRLNPEGVSPQGDVAAVLAASGRCEGPAAEPPCIEVQFTAKVRQPFWPFLAGALGLLLLGFLATRPRFPPNAQLRVDDISPWELAVAEPRKWRSGRIVLGGGPDAAIVLGSVQSPCLALEPSWHGSLLGRLLRAHRVAHDISCTLRLDEFSGIVLNSLSQPVEDGETVRLGGTQMDGDKLSVTCGEKIVILRFTRAIDAGDQGIFGVGSDQATPGSDNIFDE